MPGDRKWVGIAPISGPPKASRSAFLSMPAMTALRTLMLLNGLTVVFRAMYRKRPVKPPGRNCDLYEVVACFRIAGGARQVDHQRLLVGRLDARYRLGLAGRVLLGTDDVAPVGPGIAVAHLRQEVALHRVLHVRRGDLAVHGRAELDTRLDVNRDR